MSLRQALRDATPPASGAGGSAGGSADGGGKAPEPRDGAADYSSPPGELLAHAHRVNLVSVGESAEHRGPLHHDADDFTDDINSLRFLFLGQGEILAPGPLPDESHPCGLDPTARDDATCESYSPDVACP